MPHPAGICKVSLAGGWEMWYNTPCYTPVAKLVYAMDLGDVTSVQGFHPIIRRAHSLVKAGPSCFIDADQALCSASGIPSPSKSRGQ